MAVASLPGHRTSSGGVGVVVKALYHKLGAGLFRGAAPSICRGYSIVHSPPPQYEDPDILNGGESKDLAAHAGRELDPPRTGHATGFVESVNRLGLADRMRQLDEPAVAAAKYE